MLLVPSTPNPCSTGLRARLLPVLGALAMSLACAGAKAQTASAVEIEPSLGTIAIDAGLQALIAFTGASTVATGSGHVSNGSFWADIVSAWVPGDGLGAITLQWAPDAGIRFANAEASFTFQGFEFHADTATITSDLVFKSAKEASARTYNDVSFLVVRDLTGSVGEQPLGGVAPGGTPAKVQLAGTAYLDLKGLAPVVADLGIQSLPVAGEPLAGKVAVASQVPEASSASAMLLGLAGLVVLGVRRQGAGWHTRARS